MRTLMGSQESREFPPASTDEYVEWGIAHTVTKGAGGYYQWRALNLVGLEWFFGAAFTYYISFVATRPDIGAVAGRVLVGGEDVCTSELRGQLLNGICKTLSEDWENVTCPEVPKDCCFADRKEWEYREAWNSLTADFDLFKCKQEEEWQVALTGTFFWLAYGVGVTAGGAFSDSFGRNIAGYVALVTMLVGQLIGALAPSILVWSLARCLCGVGTGMYGLVTFVWVSESITTSMRAKLTWYPNLFFVAGGISVAVLDRLGQGWRTYTFYFFALGLSMFVIQTLMVESPKWLATKGMREKMHEVVNIIAKTNAVPPLKEPSLELKRDPKSGELEDDGIAQGGFRDLLHPKLIVRLPVLAFVWLVCGYSYYGLTMVKPPRLFPDPTLDWSWGFIIELPAYYVGGLLIETRLGRKVTAYGIGLAGLLLLIFAFKAALGPGFTGLLNILYYPARMGVAMSFGVIYPWSTELFPSNIRSVGMGCVSFAARIGSMITPWLDLVESFEIRMLLVAVPCLLAGVLAALFLPETRGKPLPGTVNDL